MFNFLDLMLWAKELEIERGKKSSVNIIIVHDQVLINGVYYSDSKSIVTVNKMVSDTELDTLKQPQLLLDEYRKTFLKPVTGDSHE